MDRDEIDRVLRQKRRPQSKACYPCHQRKVRCDHGQPCHTCQRRGHPEICTYSAIATTKRRDRRFRPRLDDGQQVVEVAHSAASLRNSTHGTAMSSPGEGVLLSLAFSQSAPDRLNGRSLAGPSLSSANRAASAEDTTSAERTYEGDNSILAVLQQHVKDPPSSSRIRDARVSLGLQNTISSDPFVNVPTTQQRQASLLDIAPQGQEIHRFYPSYRSIAYPFVPFLVDVDQVELRISKYLENQATKELHGGSHLVDEWASDEGITFIALILAILSCGSHFSNLSFTQRYDASREFVRRAFRALRLANYMLQPSLDAIQTLLILGNTLQNIGQSDGAWVLLGTTIRLAQALGLHVENSGYQASESSAKAKELWAVVVWQDCFLSVCHGRPPSVSKVQLQSLNLSSATSSGLSYMRVMLSVAYFCFEAAESKPNMEISARLVQAIDNSYSQAQPHLRDREACCNLQELLEHFALQINVSFAICFLCRPAVRKFTQGSRSEDQQFLTDRAKQSLLATLKAFLAFHTLSIVPMRNWSMIHSALSSMLLLCLWEETRNDPEARGLQERMVNVLASSGQHSTEDLDANNEQHSRTHWLSTRHVRTLAALLEVIRSTSPSTPGTPPDKSAHTSDASDLNGADTANNDISIAFDPIPDQLFAIIGQNSLDEGYQFPWISTDLSPIAYLDEVMNAPFNDIFQYNEVL